MRSWPLSLCLVPPRRPYTDQTLASTTATSSVISHNPFTSTSHPQPPLHPSQRSESSPTPSQHSAHNPFVHCTLPTRSDDGVATSESSTIVTLMSLSKSCSPDCKRAISGGNDRQSSTEDQTLLRLARNECFVSG
jgi:hypothetical protein